ncbi:FAD dependent oxidoreductase [Phanerochaete sordida]|uniref:FAD dependent oxidoreductase n=1 Tax=Phanerochaete sordida TaxID=48140 RepID=A0A9P3LG40_9APHY|nr:FAD dependent oxidoreductase [Phanerochaete sordida]
MSHVADLKNLYLVKENNELVLKQGVNPNATKNAGKHILIVGGGVTGLTNAWALLDQGYAVTIISDKWASLEDRITSQIAGALWEWPPAVCGRHTDLISLKLSKTWCMTSYRAFQKLQEVLPADGEHGHGIRMRTANFFFDKPIEENPDEYEKMQEIEAAKIPGFERDSLLVTKHAVSQEAGVVDAYKHTTPVVDTDAYMVWLRSVVEAKSGKFVTHHIQGDLLEQEDALLRVFGADYIIDATGLGAFEAAGDRTVYPLRGALIRIVNDGTKFPKVNEALVVAHDYAKRDDDGGIVFIVPRNDKILILGGIAQANEGKLDLTVDSPEMKRMRDRCNRFVPGLELAEVDPVSPVVQGLRPVRGENVRVERELRKKADGSLSKIVHSYGQGGSGFTLSFGCAGDVVDLIKEAEEGVEPTPLKADRKTIVIRT